MDVYLDSSSVDNAQQLYSSAALPFYNFNYSSNSTTILKSSPWTSIKAPLSSSASKVNEVINEDIFTRLAEINSIESTVKFLYHDMWEIGTDPRTDTFPLVSGGPWTIFSIILGYLYFVKVLGPELMKDRPAYNLKSLILVYNLSMMCFNFVFFYFAASYTRLGIDSWGCTPPDPTKWDAVWQFNLRMVWYFLISKFVDLFETIFFVLRKKHNQASTLHVFHHSIVPIDVWVGLKYVPSESACFFPMINSFVHTLMYAYYALSTFGPKMQPYLWWKRYLTSIQICQLILVAFHSLHLILIPNCDIHKAIFVVYFPQALMLVYLFCSFFVKSYLKSNTTNQQTKRLTKQEPHEEKVSTPEVK